MKLNFVISLHKKERQILNIIDSFVCCVKNIGYYWKVLLDLNTKMKEQIFYTQLF